MPNTVLLKKSSVANSVPTTGDLQPGELALNYTDGNLFYKNASNVVTVIASNKSISLSGNITGGNISATSHTGSVVSVTGNITGGNISATSHTGSVVSVTGNVTGGNILTGGLISATSTITSAANITGGNLTTTGKGNIGELFVTTSAGDEGGQINLALAVTNTTLSGNVVIDVYQNRLRFYEGGGTNRGAYIDLSQAANLVGTNLLSGGGGGTPGGANTYVQFNDSGLFGGNAQFTYDKVLNTLTAGTFAGTLNGSGQNFKVGDDAWIGDINIADTIGIKGQQNASNAFIVFGNADATGKLGRSGTGPLTYAGAFSATGNITGGNLTTAGLITSTGNITGGNILTGGLISATSTITSAANITGGNLLTGGLISAAGNVLVGTRLFVASGNASAPGITFSADTSQDTGFYWVSDGNIGVTTNGTLRATFLDTGLSVVGNVSSGNLNVTGNIVDSGALSIITGSNGNIALAPNGTGIVTVSSAFSATGNITGGNLLTGGLISATSTITSAANITGGNLLTGGLISSTGNITGGNISATSHTGSVVSVTGNITGGNISATSHTGAVVSVTGNITGGNISATSHTGAVVSVTGNITGGNLVAGTLSLSGNTISSTDSIITIDPAAAGNTGAVIIQGNLSVTGNVTYIDSNTITTNDLMINVANNAATAAQANGGGIGVGPVTGAYATLTYNSTSNTWVISNGANISGTLSASGNIIGGNVSATSHTGSVVSVTGNVTGGNLLTGGLISATGNITSGNLVTGGLVTVTGNITGGNILTAGLISSTGTITSAGNLSLTGNIVDIGELWINTTSNGNINLNPNGTGQTNIPTGVLNVTGNIQSGNLRTTGLVSATGNVTGGNLITAGIVTATGNISGNYFIGNGSLLTGISGGGNTAGGYFNSTLTTYPTGDYGNGEAYCGASPSTDAFNIIILPNFDDIDPQGSYVTVDLGA